MIPLTKIVRTSNLDKEYFEDTFLKTNQPVVIEGLSDHWEASQKWSLDFFKKQYGDLKVPVYCADTYRNPGKKYLKAKQIMLLSEYIKRIQEGESDLRLFLYNIFNHVPELSADYKVPDITSGFYKEFPYTFFGGKGAKVGMHYDMDLSHVFLTQFEGRKRIVLFPPECSEALYKLPFSVASYVDVDNPDYERYPALKNAKGYECILNPGETLFMPSGYWHYITYLDAGFSMSQRGHNAFFKRIHGLCNIATHYVVDKGMNRIVGNSWSKWKQEVAKKRGLRSLDS